MNFINPILYLVSSYFNLCGLRLYIWTRKINFSQRQGMGVCAISQVLYDYEVASGAYNAGLSHRFRIYKPSNAVCAVKLSNAFHTACKEMFYPQYSEAGNIL